MRRTPELLERHLFLILSGAVLAAAFLYMRRTTAGLEWPYDVDLFRDIGQASSVRNGNLIADLNFAGEVTHYNPLLSWVIAVGSAITGTSTAAFATQGGIVLNLLGPVAFTVLVRRWFGRLAAGFALVAFLFVMCAHHPSWAVATYSPWPFQANFGQGLFYLALLALPAGVEGGRRRDPVVLGAAIGVVVLAHTGPSVVLLGIYVVVVLQRRWARSTGWAATARRVAITGGTAALVASPFIVPLVWRYRLRIRNEAPGRWVWWEIQPESIGGFAWDFLTRWQLVLAAIGVVVWWVRDRRSVADVHVTVAAAWTGVSLVALAAATYAATALPLEGAIPSIVPSYHYLLYLSAALCLWFGVGCAALLRAGWGRVANRPRRRRFGVPITAAVLAGVLVAGWRARSDFGAAREASLELASRYEHFAFTRWIATATDEDDVILYDLDPTMVLEAGALDERHTVVLDSLFANPFVDWNGREADASSMLSALHRCRVEEAAALLERYGVRHVVTATGSPLATAGTGCARLTTVYADGVATVLQIA